MALNQIDFTSVGDSGFEPEGRAKISQQLYISIFIE
jgi:hypothetical protein